MINKIENKERKYLRRVLIVLSTVDQGGGVQNKMMDLYRYIDRSRVQFDFFVHAKHAEKSFEEEIRSLGGKVYYLGRIREIGVFNYVKGLYKIIRKQNYHAVHSLIGLKDSLILIVSRLARVKIRISHVRTNVDRSSKRSLFSALLRTLIKNNATNLLASSKLAGESLYGKSPFTVIPNALDIQKFMNVSKEEVKILKRKIQFNDNTIVLGHIGRFSYEKNHDFLLQLANRLQERSVDFKIILVGEGELKKEFEYKVKKLKLEQYFFLTGVQLNVEVYYHAMDIFLFPSIHEGFGNVAIEAQVSKKYVIASKAVSPEVDLGLKLIDFISLNQIEVWVEKIINYNRKLPIDMTEQQISSVLRKRLFDLEGSIKEYYTIYED